MTNILDVQTIKSAALEEAKRAAGGTSALSRALGGKPTSQAISQWRWVPPARVLAVEAVTGVSRHRLAPEYYPEQKS